MVQLNFKFSSNYNSHGQGSLNAKYAYFNFPYLSQHCSSGLDRARLLEKSYGKGFGLSVRFS